MERISTRLQGIFNELECIDDPRRDPIRVVLQSCISDVLAFEANFGFPDLAKENESLKAKFEAEKKALEAENEDQNEQIKSLSKQVDELAKINSANTEHASHPNERYLPLLSKLRTHTQAHQSVAELANKCGLSEAVINIQLNELIDGKWVETTFETKKGTVAWRTIKADKFILDRFGSDVAESDEVRKAESEISEKRPTDAGFDILKAIGAKGAGGIPLLEIASILRIPVNQFGDIEVHLSELEDAGYVEHGGFNAIGAKIFKNTVKGSRYVMDKRDAAKTPKSLDFTTAQRRILAFLDERGEVGAEAVAELLGIHLQSAVAQLNELQGGNNKIVSACWRNNVYLYSLGNEGKKLAAEQRK